MEFFRCRHCGNIIAYMHKSGVKVVCCGEEMQPITENTVDAAHEKHVPVVTREGRRVSVNVGSIDHPMVPEHYIEWIYLETKAGKQCKYLHPGEAPHATFYIADDDEIIKVYEYCNIHGLWSV